MSPVRVRGQRWVAAGAFLALALLWRRGPRNEWAGDQPTPRPPPPTDASWLDDWLACAESAVPHLRPGTAKRVVWHGAAGQRTPWSVVHLHGFSASRLETAPLAEQVAARLGANLFETRLSGHGQDAQALGQATAQDWLADTLEALQVGQLLGERVLVLGVSTGATLANWLALQPQGHAVAAHVWVSPNHGPALKRSELINGPWGQQLAFALEGDMRGPLTTKDEREKQAWTLRHPTRALFPMMALVKRVREGDLSVMRAPVLVLHSARDQMVDARATRRVFERLGSPVKQRVQVNDSEAQGQHVLAGDITAPNSTAPMTERVVQWVMGLV